MTLMQTAALRRILRRLWTDYIKKHTRMLVMAGVLLVITSATTSVQPLLIQQVFDRIFKQQDSYYLVVIPLAIIAVFIVQAFTLYYSNYLMAKFNNLMVADMRKSLFSHVMENEVEFYTKNDSGSLISRLVSEIPIITSSISTFFNAWCRQVLTSLGLLAVMMYQSMELTLVALIAFVIAFLPLRRVTSRLKKLHRQIKEKNAHLNTRLIESLAGIRTVKAFRKESFETHKMGRYIDDLEEFATKSNAVSLVTAPLMLIIGGFSIAFVIWFGGRELMAGRMTEGNLVAFMASLMMFTRPVRSLSNFGGVMVKGYVAVDRLFEILDYKPKFISRDHGNTLAVGKAEIVFDRVGFVYPNGTEAIRDITLTFEAGKKTALVGHSGSGKSTIFNLLMKFYAPTSGTISVDGQDLTAASINSARENLALVSQDIFIFDDTARANIGYGREGATEAEIVEAAKAARCHEFIMQLPDGYDTRLGFAGESLSGGQKQRIAIARAFLRNAPILLLDEATSALDPKTEADIQASLEMLSKGRTTIIIAHRLSTVIHVDKMVLMDGGQVAATGTHESLLRDSALYRNHFGIG